jgi:fatty-acyl-CoA synthase
MLSRGGCFSHAGTFEATAALDQLEREKVTMAFPAFELIWMSILDHPRFPDADLSALRIVQNVGVPERLQAMQARVPQAVQVSCFGSTESGGSICLGSAEDSLHSRTHTSGKPMPGVELKVVDEDGNELGPNLPGELLHRAVSQFDGYYRDPETTAAAVDADGWFHTGDLMCWEDDGSIRFIGRLKDMLKVGGENVSAADIEDYLLSHPAVAVAAVVGAPDSRYGEVPAAFVRLVAGAQVSERELIQYCDGQIAGYKVPRYVRIVDEFPVTPTSKIQKFVLRDRIAAELREAGITEAPRFR